MWHHLSSSTSTIAAHSSGQEESLARKMPEKVLEGAAEEIGEKGVDAALQNDYVQNAQEEAKVCRLFY